MRKEKKDIPMVIIDTRSKKLQSLQDQRILQQTPLDKQDLLPILMALLHRLVEVLRDTFGGLHHRFYHFLRTYLFEKRIPWIQVGVVALTAFVLVKKDLHFNFALKAPIGIFADDSDETTNNQDSRQSVALSNPHAPLSAAMLHEQKAKAFIKKYAPTAKKEMKKYGIPASIKMAQALIESRAGTSRLAVNNSNYFGMKCFSKNCRKGHCSNATDDHHKDFFRKYKNAKESFRAHSVLLSSKRYKHLTAHEGDYKKWAVGLKKAGYATDKKYAQKLINTIEKYQLYRLDDF